MSSPEPITRTSHRAMIARCTNPKHMAYPNYGGAGIQVHPEWRGSGGYRRFLEHVGPRPSRYYTIDRIDSDGHYVPGNVRWLTRSEQLIGIRDTSSDVVEVDGRTLSKGAWAKHLGISFGTLRRRLTRGWGLDAYRVKRGVRRA